MSTSTTRNGSAPVSLAVLSEIEQRVLWLATRIVDAANHDRDTGDGVKVGGHQASSASLVSAMTALYFAHLDAPDKVSVKPHASPVFHAIQYLLGNLDRSYLPALRAFGGLQSYPSRTKDPDVVDFSTGSVGLGAAAPAFALTLSGTVANDVNGGGVLDPTDTPLSGISVTLQPTSGGAAATTMTAANGTYSFSGLAINTYTVTVGAVPGLNNDTPGSVTVTLDADRGGVDFLFVVPGLIGGRVISDLNGNGIAEPTEPGIPGVSVDLDRLDNLGQATLVTTVTTGACRRIKPSAAPRR